MEEEKDNIFIVFRGLPEVWGKNLDTAEDRAQELCRKNKDDYTILAVPRETVEESGLAFRFHGVMMHSLQELMKEE